MARRLTDAVRRRCRKTALAAADWYVRTQCVVKHPFTDANVGRLVYNYHMPTRSKIWGLSWTQARGIFVLLNAYKVTGDEKYSRAIQRAGLYLKGLQKLDPRDRRFFGCIPEAVPMEHFCYPRDAMEAAEGLVLMHRFTGKSDWLERARLARDWFVRYVLDDGWPVGGVFFETGEFRKMRGCWQLGSAKFLYQLYQAERDRRAYERAVRPMCDIVVRELQRPDGSMIPHLPVPPRADHHSGKGAEVGVCYNDDGAGVALVGAWRVLGERRYLESAVALGDWMTTRRPPFPCHVAASNFANLLLELHRLTKRGCYLEWVIEHLPHILALQVRGSGDPEADGAFRGEDELVKWYFGGEPKEYVNTRNTAYSALALFKLDGAAFGPGYSTYGSRVPRARRLISDKELITNP